MSTGAIVMLIVGAVGLWGGLAAGIWNYLRKAKADVTSGENGQV